MISRPSRHNELRTPLTAMRTNLEVLSTLNLSDDQREEIIEETIRTQSRVEATLSALERLAQGQLTTEDDHVPVDITELLTAPRTTRIAAIRILRFRWCRRPRF